MKKVDDHTVAWAVRNGGKVVARGRTVYSRDGKLRTMTWTGTNAKGQKVDNSGVFERQ